MSYEKQNFEDNQVLEASDLNHIEDGIVDNERAIEKKQDKLVSGSNIKTINNQSLIGSGNISINPDLSGYATKEFVQTEIEQAQLENKEIDLSGYATKTELNNKADKTELNSYATKSELNNKANKTELNIYATKSELNNKANRTELNSYVNKTELTSYATKEFVQTEIEQAQLEDKEIDLSSYQLKNDNDLQTSNKTIVGAINEIDTKSLSAIDYTDGTDIIIEDVSNVDLSNYQQKTDNNLQTSSKELVGAINELFQSANNGKELIANAIGEPLNAEDTFSAMSSDINSLLNQFKTNMMKNGVTVNNGDKFKSLIDKISTMVEEGGNKGTQYAMGTASSIPINGSITINTNLDFTPTVIFCHFPVLRYNTEYSGSASNHKHVNFCLCSDFPIYDNNWASVAEGSDKLIISDVGQNSFKLTASPAYGGYTDSSKHNIWTEGTTTWYAIGVGEEDTTLRDSLANILENKGVEVSPDDDMASLISKVSLFDDYTPSPLYIVNNGVVNTDFKIIKQSSGYSMTQHSDHILFNIPKGTSNNSMAISTSTKFNLTNYSNIVVRYYASGGRFDLGINTTQSNSNYNNYVHWLGENQVNQETTYRFNISNYNDKYYIIIDVDNLSASVTSTLKIYDIYLEK